LLRNALLKQTLCCQTYIFINYTYQFRRYDSLESLTDGKSKFEYCVSVITHICLISHVFFFLPFSIFARTWDTNSNSHSCIHKKGLEMQKRGNRKPSSERHAIQRQKKRIKTMIQKSLYRKLKTGKHEPDKNRK